MQREPHKEHYSFRVDIFRMGRNSIFEHILNLILES